MTTVETLAMCLLHFASMDSANAAIHCGEVRYSPITFRVAEALDDVTNKSDEELSDPVDFILTAVLAHRGAYSEDTGR